MPGGKKKYIKLFQKFITFPCAFLNGLSLTKSKKRKEKKRKKKQKNKKNISLHIL